MSEYWVSNAKKFCEICKTWIADNRISVENHEQGVKHKAMIQQRLREMSKRAKQKDAEQSNLNATLIAMEQAALASMGKSGKATTSRFSAPTIGLIPTPTIASEIEQQRVAIQQQIDERKRKVQEHHDKLKKSERTVLDEDSIFKKRKYEYENEFRKEVSSKRSWDVRKLATPDAVKVEPVKIETGQEDQSEHVEREPVRHSGGLGPWIPIRKEAPSIAELQKLDEKKVILDDLPEQEGPTKVDPLFDEDDVGAEVDFKEKVLPSTSSSKKSKPVFFRKPKGSKGVKIKEEN